MYSILLNEVGYPGIAKDNWGIDKDVIKAYISETSDSDKKLLNAYNYFNNSIEPGVYMPINRNGEKYSGPFSLDGYHKNGKNYIPKDNYHALLHKGEMVLDSEAAPKSVPV